METLTKIINGAKVVYKLTREKGFFTNHVWVYKNNIPLFHFMPSENAGFSRCFKNCGKYGYLPMGEIAVSFENINLSNIYLS